MILELRANRCEPTKQTIFSTWTLLVMGNVSSSIVSLSNVLSVVILFLSIRGVPCDFEGFSRKEKSTVLFQEPSRPIYKHFLLLYFLIRSVCHAHYVDSVIRFSSREATRNQRKIPRKRKEKKNWREANEKVVRTFSFSGVGTVSTRTNRIPWQIARYIRNSIILSVEIKRH